MRVEAFWVELKTALARSFYDDIWRAVAEALEARD